MPWAVKWRSDNRLDGKREYLVGGGWPRPDFFSGYTRAVFRTRQQARDFAKKEYGYIGKSRDLQIEPFGWKAPIVVRVKVTVEEC